MKKFTAIFLAVLTALMITARAFASAPDNIDKASSAILIDADSGSIIYAKNHEKRVEVAGLKRLPALLLICEAFDRGDIAGDTVVTVSYEASRVKGATAFLSPNENIKAEYLLKASVMITAGDAISALMSSVYPSEAAGKEALANRLSALGIERQEGDESEQYSALEIAKVCSELVKSESFLKYSSIYTDSIPHENAKDTGLTNPNRLVRFYSGCFGLATGSVGASEYAGAFIARRGSTTFLAVIAGMSDSASRFELAQSMLDSGFSSFRTTEVLDESETLATVPVKGGRLDSVEVSAKGGVTVLLPVGEAKIGTEFVLPEYVEAPVKEGDELGSLIVKNSLGETVASFPLTAKNAVETARFSDFIMELIASWLRSGRS